MQTIKINIEIDKSGNNASYEFTTGYKCIARIEEKPGKIELSANSLGISGRVPFSSFVEAVEYADEAITRFFDRVGIDIEFNV